MPIYEYECEKCKNRFDAIVKMDGSDAPEKCPALNPPDQEEVFCNGKVKRVMSTPASTFPGASKW